MPAVPVPDDAARSQSRQHGMPLVPAQSWKRDPAWRTALRTILAEVGPAASETAAATLKAIGTLEDAALDGLAERVLRTERYFGKVSRSFQLGQDIDESKSAAKFTDGVLELTLPKKAAAAAKRLTID